jgi:arylamine N-acetyltransferase
MKLYSLAKGSSLTIRLRGHIILIVTLSDGTRWAVDVCFGSDGPTQPMQLVESSISRNMGPKTAVTYVDISPARFHVPQDTKCGFTSVATMNPSRGRLSMASTTHWSGSRQTLRWSIASRGAAHRVPP